MRCLIYSSNSFFGQCLCVGLTAVDGVEFARACATTDEVVFWYGQEDVSSVLVDLSCKSKEQTVRIIARELPNVCILALSVDDKEASEVVECARLGCHGIVPQNASIDDAVRIVRAAERGEVAVRPEVSASMMRALAEGSEVVAADNLTECLSRREREICSLVCEGLTNKEIAQEVSRSVGTVKNHVQSILSKLKVSRRGAINAYLGQSVIRGYPSIHASTRRG